MTGWVVDTTTHDIILIEAGLIFFGVGAACTFSCQQAAMQHLKHVHNVPSSNLYQDGRRSAIGQQC